MQVLCTQCKKIYTAGTQSKQYSSWIVFGILLVLSTYFIQTEFWTNTSSILVALSIFIPGLVLLLYLSKKEQDCKLCHGKKTLIAVDSPEGIEIIKESNLSIHKDSRHNQPPWKSR